MRTQALPLWLVLLLSVPSCGEPGDDELAQIEALIRAHRGLTADEIAKLHGHEFIDVSCIITPRPTMDQPSAVFAYDYATSGNTTGLSPMTATFTPDSESGSGTIIVTSDEWEAGTQAVVEVSRAHRITIGWASTAASDRPTVFIEDILDPASPTTEVSDDLTKMRWSQLPWGILVTYLQNAAPHVIAWPISEDEQWLFVRTGNYWVKLKMLR